MNEQEYDFGYGEIFSYSLYQADAVGDARKEPGVYAWYVRTPLTEAAEALCDPYRKVFAEKRFEVAATAPLGEKLIGRLSRHQEKLRPPKAGNALNEALFANAFAVFAPPVYIGRSKSIRGRLQQHVVSLKAALEKKLEDDPAAVAPGDTDDESAQFGSRVGTLLRNRGVTDYRGLFVKVVYAPDNAATKRVELILNRTFHPTLGRL
jgi:hypothetical protein